MSAVATAAPTYVKGFESLEEEIIVDALPVAGELPVWLTGSLLRTGPAKFEAGGQRMNHWFDGLAMLHRFTFGDGRVSYGNRFLEGRTERAVRREGRIAYPEFATDPCRSLFKRVQTLFAGGPEFGDNANINVVKLGERFFSMTETPISVEFDPRTLAAAGVPFMPPGHVTTAHPHADRATGAMLSYALHLGPRSEYRFFRLDPDSDTPRVVARIPVREPGYVHSFGLTERHFVLIEFPWLVNPLRLALAGKPYAENFRFKPERGTRIFLVDRETGAASEPIVTDPFFGFHHVNAYEDGDAVVVDVAVYPDASLIEELYLDRLRDGAPASLPELRRFRIADGAVTHERLIDEGIELAQINYEHHNERPYRYAWGIGGAAGDWADRIVKADVRDRDANVWHEPGTYPGEPVFVGRPDAQRSEDDGVVLSVVLDTARGTSFLLVLDAADLSELARAEVPHHIPFSFHGRFARSVT